ncbi:hypothetical protein ACQUWN_02360 [Rossellomorea aquimaris]|uniref:hypothetical protein n=1 Tax=Bacillaceae TaxID=186817 RepID=UPI001653C472|nr:MULTISPECIES: hypothetical protein [Bacillaceae]
MKERNPISSTEVPQNRDELFGLDKQESLQSANFATNENSYLNENYQDELEE